ncbi:hypothetical protein K3495_g11503 [Podosphaera aphanis]|nr:hypothetical protein K3495_g11503 [Podosphaera aphanis]
MSTQASQTGSKRAPYLTRDQRLQILTLHGARKTHREIASQLGVTYNQARATIRSGRVSPQPRSGRPRVLSAAQVDEMEEFIRQEARQVSYLEISLHFSHWGVGEFAIRSALKQRRHERSLSEGQPLASRGPSDGAENIG